MYRNNCENISNLQMFITHARIVYLKVVDILTVLPEHQTPSLNFWGLDLHLYTKRQEVKKNYSKLYYSLHLMLKFAFGVCVILTLNT